VYLLKKVSAGITFSTHTHQTHKGYKCFVTRNVLKSSTDDFKVVFNIKIEVIFIETVCEPGLVIYA
jgi:hypothetical protein